ncbi:MAG: hypothetical protein IJ833_06425 [Lachnospiraceae bacterium]|nr:hypothetical protein [Lachnospiraceae bacterium]
MKTGKFNLESLMIAVYYILYIAVALTLVFVQPFGDPPDEVGRNAIVQYIWYYAKLPNGFEESIRINGYGFSYAFQPILPYIIQALVMRVATFLFHPTSAALLYIARMVNFTFGLMMAHFVLQLSRLLFADKRLQYLFSFLVMFLPQSIFMHTYVNTDSCCMLSIAVMLYGLIRGTKEHFSMRSCITLSVGIILCALSYYNAYGFILSSILLFTAFYLSVQNHRLSFDWKSFLQKGIFISIVVLAGIGWWFVRSYILYDGDFLGLKTRDYCASLYAIPTVNPLTRITFQNQGYSVWYMLRNTNFIQSTVDSFICMYGPLTIATSVWVYRFYKLLFAAGLLCCIILPWKKLSTDNSLYTERPGYRVFFTVNMIFCALMPCILSITYSYTTDYQAQGRYVLPALIPMVYFVVRGIHKGLCAAKLCLQKLITQKPIKDDCFNHLSTGLVVFICFVIVFCLLLTIYKVVVPYYAAFNG